MRILITVPYFYRHANVPRCYLHLLLRMQLPAGYIVSQIGEKDTVTCHAERSEASECAIPEVVARDAERSEAGHVTVSPHSKARGRTQHALLALALATGIYENYGSSLPLRTSRLMNSRRRTISIRSLPPFSYHCRSQRTETISSGVKPHWARISVSGTAFSTPGTIVISSSEWVCGFISVSFRLLEGVPPHHFLHWPLARSDLFSERGPAHTFSNNTPIFTVRTSSPLLLISSCNKHKRK